MVGPSRASQIKGAPDGAFGLRRYCQSHRSWLASAASVPKTRRYSASAAGRSSGRNRSTSATGGTCRREDIFHVADQRVLHRRMIAQPPANDRRQSAHRTRDVQFFADDVEPGGGNLTAQSLHANELEQVVFFDHAFLSVPNERVLMRGLAQRPRRVSRQQTKRS